VPAICFIVLLIHCICRRFQPFFNRYCWDFDENFLWFGNGNSSNSQNSKAPNRIFYDIPESMELDIEIFTIHQIIFRFSRLLLMQSTKKHCTISKQRLLAMVLIRTVSENVGRLNALSVSSLIEYASDRKTLFEIPKLKQHQFEQKLSSCVIQAMKSETDEPHELRNVG